MRTVKESAPEQIGRRARFEFNPDRHYVLVQKPDANWDGQQMDRIMDEVDSSGNDAYRVEADGANGTDDRRVTGSRQMVMLSCHKSHIQEKIKGAANISHSNAHAVVPNPDYDEKLEYRQAISVEDIPNSEIKTAPDRQRQSGNVISFGADINSA